MSTSTMDDAPPSIEFWFDFASNYSYLTVMRIEAAARHHGVQIIWKPFLLGPIFRALGMETSPFVMQKLKGDHVWQDMRRQGRKYGLSWTRPSVFPRRSVLPLRVALIGADQPWMPDYCRAVMSLNFEQDVEIDQVPAIGAVLADLGLPHEQLIAEALSEANKSRLRAQTQEALDRGVFGAPSLFVGQEMFWGNDRLDDALAFCREQGASKAASN